MVGATGSVTGWPEGIRQAYGGNLQKSVTVDPIPSLQKTVRTAFVLPASHRDLKVLPPIHLTAFHDSAEPLLVGETLDIRHPGIRTIHVSAAVTRIQRNMCEHHIRRVGEIEPIQRLQQLSARVIDLNAASRRRA